jgi:hypothetical protein
LTEPGEAIAAKADRDHFRHADYTFEVSELHVGGRVHKGLTVSAARLTLYADAVKNQPNAKAARAADPKARVYTLILDVDRPGLWGLGVGGRVREMAGVLDREGALLFADKPADAPVIRFDGSLQVTLYGEKPVLKLDRDNDLFLVVGTPGRGPGTFAMIAYEDTIPAKAVPKVEIQFLAARDKGPPVRELYELKQRC